MKTINALVCFGTLSLAKALPAHDFINLGFDNPNFPLNNPPLGALTAYAIPGWSLVDERMDPRFLSVLWIGDPREGVTLTTLLNRVPHTGNESFGKYSLYFYNRDGERGASYQLSQTGLIPGNAETLRIFAAPWTPEDLVAAKRFQFLINDKSVELKQPPGSLGAVIDVDVSPWAGQEVELKFIFAHSAAHYFDIAGFTTTPEPPAYALFTVGSGLLWWIHRKRAIRSPDEGKVKR